MTMFARHVFCKCGVCCLVCLFHPSALELSDAVCRCQWSVRTRIAGQDQGWWEDDAKKGGLVALGFGQFAWLSIFPGKNVTYMVWSIYITYVAILAIVLHWIQTSSCMILQVLFQWSIRTICTCFWFCSAHVRTKMNGPPDQTSKELNISLRLPVNTSKMVPLSQLGYPFWGNQTAWNGDPQSISNSSVTIIRVAMMLWRIIQVVCCWVVTTYLTLWHHCWHMGSIRWELFGVRVTSNLCMFI